MHYLVFNGKLLQIESYSYKSRNHKLLRYS